MLFDINEKYEVMDGCYGRVTGRCQEGVFLELDNGQEAFAYNFSSLVPGTEVLCSVLSQVEENRKMLVSIDSVSEYLQFYAA